MRNFRYFIFVIVLTCTGVAAQVSPTMPVPNRNMTVPSAHGSPGVHPESVAGTIEGFVYWDANSVSHIPANSCSGLAITVSVGSSSGPFTAYTPLGTLSNNFKYVGEVKEFLVGGKVNVYDVCTYAYDKVPVGPDLQVTLTVAQSGEFLPGAVPQFATLGPIKIINAQCNMLPRIVNPTASDLATHWGSCQNMAYDVNFVMLKTPRQQLGLASPPPGSSGSHGGMPASAPQQGMLLSGSTQNGQSQSNSGALLGNQQVATGQSRMQQNPGSKVELNPQPFPPRQQLSNADILKMLKGGVPESVIVSSIRSANHNFDFSPAGCRELQSANVTRQVLDAMGDGSVRPCPTIRGNAEQPVGVRNVVVKLGPPKALEKVRNPRLAQQHAEIIAVLEQQRQVTDRELAAIKVNVRPPAPDTATPATVLSVTPQGSVPPGALAPVAAQGSAANLSSVISHEPQFNTLVLTCSTDPTTRVLRVNGGQGPNIFTPEPKYNHYIIAGCSFGQAQGEAHLFAPSGFTANLNIDSWSDNAIVAHLDPWLAGWLDQDNVTLVVSAVGKPLVQKQGFKFYAARGMPAPDGSDQEVQLAYDSLPQSSVTLLNESTAWIGAQRLQPLNFGVGYDQLPSNAVSQFPSVSFEGATVAGWVFRYAYGHHDDVLDRDCYINDTHYTSQGDPGSMCSSYFNYPYYTKSGGVDNWAFHLASGFEISSYQLYYEDIDPRSLCGAWDEASHKDGRVGTWTYGLAAAPNNVIVVNWPFYYCTDMEAMLPNRNNAQYQSAYGLSIWVLGPRCIDLWTAKPDQSCISKVKQILG